MTAQDVSAALAAFDQAHAGYATAVEQTPAAALRYRPEGEDYALGGLAVHVAQVLEKYTRLLDLMGTSTSEPIREQAAAPAESDAALIHDGFGDSQRSAVLQRVQAAHDGFAAALRRLPAPAFSQQVPVIFDGGTDPYPTSPADVLGWVHAHYDEHITQTADLRRAWETVAI